jgi:aspartyl-tRNA(Asn)/glutamyl-tRNA(Gln) amidotransferase subunit A
MDTAEHEDLCHSTIAELGRKLRAGDVSAVGLTRAYLARIQALDRRLNTYITVTPERALADARAAQARLRQGRPLGPLDGIPLAHKDMVLTRGIRTTCASKAMADHVPQRDAAVIARLRSAGAVLLGKLNMHEFASAGPSEHFGRVVNPWSAEHASGGSSSGSAAAVAAGLCAGSIGTDTAGSIRIPAAFCGTVGLKPTHGRVSLDGVVPLSRLLDHVGPITRSVADAAIMLRAVAGRDPCDPVSATASVDDYVSALTGDMRSRTIGVPNAFFDDWLDPEIKQVFETALGVLAGLGARMVRVDLPRLELAWPQIGAPLILPEAYLWHEPLLRARADDYGARARRHIESARALTAIDYVKAQQARERLRRAMLDACSHVDVLATPGQLVPTPRLTRRTVAVKGRELPLSLVAIAPTGPFDITGQPALMLPCGFTAGGLPVGLQLVGRPFDEATLLQIGHAYEVSAGWKPGRPSLEQRNG